MRTKLINEYVKIIDLPKNDKHFYTYQYELPSGDSSKLAIVGDISLYICTEDEFKDSISLGIYDKYDSYERTYPASKEVEVMKLFKEIANNINELTSVRKVAIKYDLD